MITNYSYALFTFKNFIHSLQIAFPVWVTVFIIVAFAIWKYR